MNEPLKQVGGQMGEAIANLAFLDPPGRLYHRWMGHPITLLVRRYEVGLLDREVEEIGQHRIFPCLRLYLDESQVEDLGPYLDFTNRGLILQMADLAIELGQRLRSPGTNVDAKLALGLLPEGSGALKLRLTRSGEGLQTRYQLELLEG